MPPKAQPYKDLAVSRRSLVDLRYVSREIRETKQLPFSGSPRPRIATLAPEGRSVSCANGVLQNPINERSSRTSPSYLPDEDLSHA